MLKRPFLMNQKVFSFAEGVGLLDESVDETVIVSGVPRSGTTWLSEMLVKQPGYKLLSEPLYLRGPVKHQDLNLEWRTHIHPEEEREDVEKYIRRALSGRIPGHYLLTSTTLLGRVIEFFRSQKNIVKFVRASRMLGWILNKFEVRGIVLLLRHPCAVVASQIQYDEDWRDSTPPNSSDIREGFGGRLPDRFINRYEKILCSLSSREEYLAAMWCIDNILSLKNLNSDNVVIAKYENLVLKNKKELRRIFDFLSFSSQIVRNIKSDNPSVTKSDSYTEEKMRQISKWEHFLSDDQADRIMKVVKDFGIDIYDRNPLSIIS